MWRNLVVVQFINTSTSSREVGAMLDPGLLGLKLVPPIPDLAPPGPEDVDQAMHHCRAVPDGKQVDQALHICRAVL